MREHILKNPYNLSFLNREDALLVAKCKKPYLSFGLLSMWIIGIILAVSESIITESSWILLFIPIGFVIPSFSRYIIKSWTQIIPIAIGTIYSNPVVFYLCVDFVIIRSLYDLWYSSVLRNAGEVLCANDSLFSQVWEDTAIAVIVDGEPYFHKNFIQNENPIVEDSSSSVNVVSKEPVANDSIREVPDIIEKDVTLIPDSSQNMNKGYEPQEKETILSYPDNNQILVATKASMVRFCNKCGQKIDEGYRFCLKCGNPIDYYSTLPTTQPMDSKQEPSCQNIEKDKPSQTKQLADEDIIQIRYWKQLLDDEIITEEEFKEKKKTILGDYK